MTSTSAVWLEKDQRMVSADMGAIHPMPMHAYAYAYAYTYAYAYAYA